MRREFTAISAFSSVIAFVAGVVLCMQVAHAGTTPGWEVSEPMIWAMEIAIFGTAVYAWRSRISLVGWFIGITGLVLVRLAVGSGAALFLAALREGQTINVALEDTSRMTPRMCAVLFSLMVCYPLRQFLPVRAARLGRQRRFAESPAVQSATGQFPGSDGDLVIWAGSEQKAGADRDRAHPVRSMLDAVRPPLGIDGALELPVRMVLAQMPHELLSDRASEIDNSQVMLIPLDVILPQLREARVVVTPAQVRGWLPSSARRALVDLDEAEEAAESQVLLPLELVVPRLPPEALALAAPSPPAWADAEGAERVVFART